MERKDFITGYDAHLGKTINVGGMSPADRANMLDLRHVRHEVVLSGTTEEMAALGRSLETLRALSELLAIATHERPGNDHLSELRATITTENIVEAGFPAIVLDPSPPESV